MNARPNSPDGIGPMNRRVALPRRRKATDLAVRTLCLVATLLALVPLLSLLQFVIVRGAGGLSWDLLTQLPRPVGETGGGMANAIVGTLVLVGLASCIGIPLGITTGIYLAEYGHTRTARVVRFSADVLSGVPSIIVGMFIYSLLVVTMKRFSALAGGLALAILMLPTIARSTEELLKLVPNSLREAALALGVPRWRATLRVILRTAAPGIATGVMLAVARAAGETAPLLFTALNSRFWPTGLDRPIASLPVQIFTYAISPYEEWHRQAWAAALVLVTLVLILNLTARFLVRHRTDGR
jgi:phosphate transport system permease protein